MTGVSAIVSGVKTPAGGEAEEEMEEESGNSETVTRTFAMR